MRMEDESEYSEDDSSILARASLAMRDQRLRKALKQQEAELKKWKENAEADGRKKQTCMVCLIVALGDDIFDVFGALASFGLLESITFPIPGMIRFFIASQEREPNPDSFMRSIIAMAIEAIPVINVLPTTTINVIIDLIQTIQEEDKAKKEVEKCEKKIKALNGQIRQLQRVA